MSKFSRIVEVFTATDNPDGLSICQIAQESDLCKQDVVYVLTESKPECFVSNVRDLYKLRPLQTEQSLK